MMPLSAADAKNYALAAACAQIRLTSSECELLAHLYLKPEQNTPILLSQNSGMKKEAVSRCLKALCEKGCIRKHRQENDERSYQLLSQKPALQN